MARIEAKYLTKVYKNGAYGLKNCSISVKKGELLVVVGASGSGKSTLIKVLAGIEQLSSGELYIDGILADNIPAEKKDVSMVFQEYVLYPHMTVFDNLATPLRLSGEDEKLIYDRVMETLRLFGLEIASDVKPRNLSGGEQQRVALAKVLLKRSKLVLLDEPMSNIDEKARWEYCTAIKKMKKMLPDSTFIYVTHNIKEALSLADRIAVMNDGAIVQIGTSSFLTKHFEHLSVMELLGGADNIQNGVFNGEHFIFNGMPLNEEPYMVDYSKLTQGQSIIRAQSCINDKSVYLFDENDRSLSVSSVEYKLCGSLDKNFLSFANQTVELSDEYLERLLHCSANVDVAMSAEKFSKIPVSDCFSLVFDVEENGGDYVVLKAYDKRFILNEKTNLQVGERIRLYYKAEDLILYDKQDRLTCHYSLCRNIKIKLIDANRGVIEILGKRVKIGKPITKNVKNARITKGAFKLSHDKGSCAVRVYDCLDEEFINGKKLIHISIKGNQGYLSFITDEAVSFFGKNKLWLNIVPSQLKLGTAEL